MIVEKDLEHGPFASADSSQSQLPAPEELERVSQSNFRNGLHEIIFVWVVTSAHWITVLFFLFFVNLMIIDMSSAIASQFGEHDRAYKIYRRRVRSSSGC